MPTRGQTASLQEKFTYETQVKFEYRTRASSGRNLYYFKGLLMLLFLNVNKTVRLYSPKLAAASDRLEGTKIVQ